MEDTELVENSFEINGADFLLGYDLNPMILEINGNPDMNATTSVTENICPKVIKDVIKVVVDRVKNSNASTGEFELIHTVPINRFVNTKTELDVKGKKVLPPIKTRKNILKTLIRHDLMITGASVKSLERKIKSTNNLKKISFHLKLYKTPQNPRKNLQTILVKPHSNDISYINKLPRNYHKSKKINVHDLLRCLSLH